MTFGPTAATLTLLEKLAVDNGFDRELASRGRRAYLPWHRERVFDKKR